jgi:hypothetical protein
MSANGMPPAFQFDTFPTALQNAIGQGAKSDVRLAKHFVREKLSKKVQFLQPNNDDMMKKVYAMAWRYMNYDADHFSSVWTKVVLPTIKTEIELAEERICGSNQESNHSWYGYMYCWMRICLQLINKPIACLSHNKYV